jgi:hypothetical protein
MKSNDDPLLKMRFLLVRISSVLPAAQVAIC